MKEPVAGANNLTESCPFAERTTVNTRANITPEPNHLMSGHIPGSNCQRALATRVVPRLEY